MIRNFLLHIAFKTFSQSLFSLISPSPSSAGDDWLSPYNGFVHG